MKTYQLISQSFKLGFDNQSELPTNVVNYLKDSLQKDQSQAYLLSFKTGTEECCFSATRHKTEAKDCLTVIVQKKAISKLEDDGIISDLDKTGYLKSSSFTKHGNMQLNYCFI